jgi:pSer/pThr/pTyr-binding forkhead associated (FHA) protein
MRRLAHRLRLADERGAAAPAPRVAPAQDKPAPATPKAAPAAPVAAQSEITARVEPEPPPPAKPAVPAPAVDTRARSPQVAPAPTGAPAPTAQSVPAGPAVVQFALRHAQGLIALPGDKAECLVGRPDPATGAIPEINLGPLDLARSLSRRHARLLVTGNTVSLREEPGVSNGTWVNGERLAAGRTIELKPGDKLRFGAIELEFGTA